MQLYLNKRTILLLLTLSSLSVTKNVVARATVNELIPALNQLSLHRTEMDFSNYFKRLKNDNVGRQSALVNKLSRQVATLSDTAHNYCDKVALDTFEFDLQLADTRLRLVAQLDASSPYYQGSFSTLHNGDQWYAHWLQSWLHSDVSLQQLETIAFSELSDASARRILLEQGELGENHIELDGDDRQAIIAAFKQREKTVYQHSGRVLGTAFKATDVNITKSTLPKSFPAPGIYDDSTQSFIYHLHGDTLPVKQMDWLFLHEAVPGHHFFRQYARNSVKCPSYKGRQGTTLFTEGWAAYVETLGHELGLYTDRTSAEYALDWQELRAVRVLLDIGIHAKGWDDDRARKVWMKHIPDQQHIMQREIDRIRRWPVQVITYVYGKAMIMQTIAEIQSRSPDTTLAQIHNDILSLSNFSLRALAHLSNFNPG